MGTEGRSLTYIWNRSGPSILLWGAPDITGNIGEVVLFIATQWVLLVR